MWNTADLFQKLCKMKIVPENIYFYMLYYLKHKIHKVLKVKIYSEILILFDTAFPK